MYTKKHKINDGRLGLHALKTYAGDSLLANDRTIWALKGVLTTIDRNTSNALKIHGFTQIPQNNPCKSTHSFPLKPGK